MRKAKAGGAPKDTDEYLAAIPEPARSTLKKIRAAIRSAVAGGGHRSHQLWHALVQVQRRAGLVRGFLRPLQFLPREAESDRYVQDELKKFQTSKGTIRFPMDKPLSAALVKKIVKARIAE